VLQRKPLVVERTAVSAADVARVVQQLRHHDPRRFPPGTPRSAVLAAHDIELLLNHGARRWAADVPVRLTVLPAAEFRQRYGGVDSPAFLRLLADIDARLAATPWW